MDILLLILIFILTYVTLNGLFNAEWRYENQKVVIGVIQKRIFWKLINSELAIFDIYRLYLISLTKNIKEKSVFINHPEIAARMILGIRKEDILKENPEQYGVSKKIIKEGNSLPKNLSILNLEIEKNELIIKNSIEKYCFDNNILSPIKIYMALAQQN